MLLKMILFVLTKHIVLTFVCVAISMRVTAECNARMGVIAPTMRLGHVTLSRVQQETTRPFLFLYQWMLLMYIWMGTTYAIL